MQESTDLVCSLPRHLRRRFTGELHLDVEFLSSFELMILQETVSVDSRLNCNRFSTRLKRSERLVETEEETV